MKFQALRRFAAFSALTMAAAFVSAQGSGTPMAGQMSHGSDTMHRQMMSGMQMMQSMKPTGDTDKDFAAMMRAHHQQAIGMAKIELEHGKSPELKAMARKLIDEQQKEIAQLDKWLGSNK